MGDLLRRLDATGLFSIRSAVPYLATLLGVSRATVYARLGAARQAVAKPGGKTPRGPAGRRLP
jgi:predicted transcriptional regulator YheO